MGVTIDDARAIAATLPRSYEALVRDQVRFRVGRIVYAAFYEDETIMGFGFPREEREALVASEPDKFLMPRPSDMRYRWMRSGSTPSTSTSCGSCSSTRGACASRRRSATPTTAQPRDEGRQEAMSSWVPGGRSRNEEGRPDDDIGHERRRAWAPVAVIR